MRALIAVGIAAIVTPFSVVDAQRSDLAVTHVNDAIAAQVDSGFSGAVLVTRGGMPIVERAFSPKGGPRTSLRDRVAIGSMTKSFTAAAIVLLQNEGRLRLEDSISRFFPDAPADKKNITVAQLLSHKSGLEGRYAGRGIAGREAAVTAILSAPLKSAPGSAYEYIDDDYELLAAIVEVVSKTAWQAYVKSKILDKFGMKDTGFEGSDWEHRGASGMTSTVEDLFRWVAFTRRRESLGDKVATQINRPLVPVQSEPPYEVAWGYGTRIYLDQGRVREMMLSGSAENGATSIARVMFEPQGYYTIIVLSKAGDHGGTTWASYLAQKIAPRKTQ